VVQNSYYPYDNDRLESRLRQVTKALQPTVTIVMFLRIKRRYGEMVALDKKTGAYIS
jgi:hypothetical protein